MKLIDQINESAIFSQSGYSADTATHDSLGNVIADTYISAVSASANITVTKEGNNKVWISGKDWSSEIANASAEITAQIPDVTGLPYVENSALDYTPGGHLVSSISGDALYAVSAECSFTAETANYSYVAETANYVADGWEYNESNEITGYSGSAIHSEAGGEGKVYTGVAPIVVDNSQTTGVISAQTARLGVQSPLYFVEDTSASTVIGISGDLTGQYIPYTASIPNYYYTNSAIVVSSDSGYVEMLGKNEIYKNEAHVRVENNYSGDKHWWVELDGADGGHIHQHWFGDNIDSAMFFEYNGFTFATANEAATPHTAVAEWLTGDWVNAKALYNHVNTASASWGKDIQAITYTATGNSAFKTNSGILTDGLIYPVGSNVARYITAGVTPSGVTVQQYQRGTATGYFTASSDGETVTLSSNGSINNPRSRVISTTHDYIYSGSTLIVDVVDAAVTVKDNSASWSNPIIETGSI